MNILRLALRNSNRCSLRSFATESSAAIAADSSSTASASDDQPETDMCNPYVKEAPQCLLCAKKIELDYKNARLLQQFVSSFSGRVYDRFVSAFRTERHLSY